MKGLRRISKCFSSNLLHLLAGLVIGFALSSQFRTLRYQWKETNFCPFKSVSYVNNEDFDQKNAVLDELIEEIRQQNEDTSLVLIGVMTAHKYLDSRALSIYKTWAQRFNGKVIFFSSSSSKYVLLTNQLKD